MAIITLMVLIIIRDSLEHGLCVNFFFFFFFTDPLNTDLLHKRYLNIHDNIFVSFIFF